jgi:hypothetical protein
MSELFTDALLAADWLHTSLDYDQKQHEKVARKLEDTQPSEFVDLPNTGERKNDCGANENPEVVGSPHWVGVDRLGLDKLYHIGGYDGGEGHLVSEQQEEIEHLDDHFDLGVEDHVS